MHTAQISRTLIGAVIDKHNMLTKQIDAFATVLRDEFLSHEFDASHCDSDIVSSSLLRIYTDDKKYTQHKELLTQHLALCVQHGREMINSYICNNSKIRDLRDTEKTHYVGDVYHVPDNALKIDEQKMRTRVAELLEEQFFANFI